MGQEEFYGQKEIPQEEIERLKQIEYPNYVSETLLQGFDLKGKKILDAGAGPNSGLAEFIQTEGGIYVPLDLRGDVLKEMGDKLKDSEVPFRGVRGDVKVLPFKDESFDLVHQRFVLMNVLSKSRPEVLREALRVGKDALLFIEYNWRTLHSSESPEVIEEFRDLAFQMFSRFSTDPYMGEKFGALFREVDPKLNYTLRSFRREEDEANTPELLLNLRGFYRGAKDFLRDDAMAGKFEKLIESLEKKPIKFVPPEIVAAIVRKP